MSILDEAVDRHFSLSESAGSRLKMMVMKLGPSLHASEDSSVVAESHARTITKIMKSEGHERADEFEEAMKEYRASLKSFHRASRNLRIIIGEMLKELK